MTELRVGVNYLIQTCSCLRELRLEYIDSHKQLVIYTFMEVNKIEWDELAINCTVCIQIYIIFTKI